MVLITWMDPIAELVGRFTKRQLKVTFSYIRFVLILIRHLHLTVLNFHLTIEQMYQVGITSIPLVITTSAFIGAVISWQFVYQFADMIPLTYLGLAVGKTVMLELGPVLTALVISGRVGAAMCSELGTMAVTEQLDAMKCLNLNPFRYLLAPRLLASVVMLPVLVIFSSFVAIFGAFIVAHLSKELTLETFFYGVKLFYTDWDLTVGLIKSVLFGFIIGSSGCFFGYYTSNGAEGVGQSTKASVVASMTAILIMAFVVTKLLL
jgi:phospholipid/cholesterol/gamma-HCH transport system permease protein